MSDPRLRAILWSIVLMSSGVLLLLFEFGVLAPYTPLIQYLLAGLFVFGAVLFFGAFARTPAEWWRVIPGWTLLTLALVLVLSTLAIDQRWLGAAIFGGLALAFTHVYLTDRAGRWWALIPGGFLLVLGLVIGFSAVLPMEWLALLLFGGLGGVFFLLFLLHRRQWWAVLPGGVLLVFAALAAVRSDDGSLTPILRWWPLLLIAAGLLTALRARRPTPDRLQVNHAPSRKSARRAPPPAAATVSGSARPTTLGEYTHPAPGAAVEVLSDPDDR